MAYTLDFAISLGSSKTGLTLNAQIVDTSGGDTGSAITTGFTEVGAGTYLLHCSTIPDAHRGGIKIYESGAPGTILAFGSINPEEAENIAQIMNKDASQTFNAKTDSLEAIRDVLSSSDITVVAAVDGDDITVVPYTTWEFTIDGLADLSDALENGVFFTVKRRHTHTDAQALLQVQEGVGLKYVDGDEADDASKATLTVAGSEDEITVHVNASVTGLIEMRDLFWDIKKLITADEDADQVATGDFHIADEAVTRELDVS